MLPAKNTNVMAKRLNARSGAKIILELSRCSKSIAGGSSASFISVQVSPGAVAPKEEELAVAV